MKICYVDESGGCEPFGVPGLSSDATPLMAFGGVVIDHSRVPQLTKDANSLKVQFYPGLFAGRSPHGHSLDCMLKELKGSDLRRWLRDRDGSKARQAKIFLGRVLDLLEANDARIIGRVWVKKPGEGLKPVASYTFAVQDIAAHFQHLLETSHDQGLMICDSREFQQNKKVSHSMFTQKHKAGGDQYPSLVETVVFAGSDNHIGLQLADWVTSGLIFPMAFSAYHGDHLRAISNGVAFDKLRTALGSQLKRLRYTYNDNTGKLRGGIVVSDPVRGKSSGLLYG